MRRLAAVLSLLCFGCGGHHAAGDDTPLPDSSVPTSDGHDPDAPPMVVPHAPPDHVVIVIEENHSTQQILGNAAAPYFNELAAAGSLFTSSFAIEHPSEPNYLDLFSGSNQGVTDDSCPHTFTAPNLAATLIAGGLTFSGYSEGLPGPGATDCQAGDYYRKHNPWVNFTNVPATANQPFTAFPTDFTQLPTVSFVIPDQQHDIHDGTIAQADTWLNQKLAGYATWAKTHNSLLIVTFDEDDNSANNHIFTVVVGQDIPVAHEPQRISHFNLLSTLLDLYNLPHVGPNAQPIDLYRVQLTDLRRTVVFISGMTSPGQDLFVRGGIDYGYASSQLGYDCNVDPGACQISIHHRNLLNPSTSALKAGDDFVDWIGAEPNQQASAVGTPADYTVDTWPAAWGPPHTVAADGYGVEVLNTWGPYWMLDVDMDCTKTVNGWFEIKSFITNGAGWEPDVAQAGTPYTTANHMGQCGRVNRFDRGSSTADIHDF